MSVEHYYTVNVHWDKERQGKLTATELNTEIEVATPPQFPKGIDGVWSPEHLFTAAINSCLMTTFLAIAEKSKLAFIHFSSKAIGKLEIVDGKYMMSEVTLHPIVTIEDETHRELAEKVLHKSEQNCLIANSVKSTILFHPEVRVGLNLTM